MTFKTIKLKKIPITIGVEKTSFDGRIKAALNIHLFFFDIRFEFNQKIVEIV